jgi:hypothetical protein
VTLPSNNKKKVKVKTMGGECSTYGAQENAYRTPVEKHEKKRLVGRQRCRWKHSI